MPVHVESLHNLNELTGTHLGFTEWVEITQEQVNTFADATGDHQWIHVDPERAKAGPFNGPIAHGYLTLALVPILAAELIEVADLRLQLNYGLDRVRFPAAVPVGAKVRVGVELTSVEPVGAEAVQVVLDCTVECDATTKPACVARLVLRWIS